MFTAHSHSGLTSVFKVTPYAEVFKMYVSTPSPLLVPVSISVL